MTFGGGGREPTMFSPVSATFFSCLSDTVLEHWGGASSSTPVCFLPQHQHWFSLFTRTSASPQQCYCWQIISLIYCEHLCTSLYTQGIGLVLQWWVCISPTLLTPLICFGLSLFFPLKNKTTNKQGSNKPCESKPTRPHSVLGTPGLPLSQSQWLEY